MNYVIIGNSAAGIGAVEAIRKVDETNPITIITEEDCLAYSRPLIAEYLSDTIDPDKMWYRNDEFYSSNNVNLRLNTRIKSVDPDAKKVITDNSEEIYFDKLLIATGGTPIVPTIEGLDAEGVFTFVRWDEVKKLKEYKANVKRAVVIGGGLIGLKAAEHLAKCGIKVTIIELAPKLLGMVLDDTAAKLLKTQFEQNKVAVHTGSSVSRVIYEHCITKGVKLTNGQHIDCDTIVVAIGVNPNIELLKDTSIKLDRGILINERCQTSCNDIYAAGDVAQGLDVLMEQNRVLPIWPVAYKQGYIAGLNMAGQSKDYEGSFAMNSLEFFHLPVISVGFGAEPADDVEEYSICDTKNKIYKKVVLKDNKLIGFTCMNCIDRAGIYTGLIRDKVDVSVFKDVLLKDDFGLIYLPKEIREQRFASIANI